ncbi:MarR family winged helix-turn-helix transcriptional regulator [Deinococcus hopiensis]|uniref:Transcriptional regulator, MarR family n=1 Tax=Deinococcus hopiensis KR-140 TaxID=695939 RepID=A0A1W1UDD3_9DEIO|nr:MarR family transcriptional regulator [Deinococcus hopiensis]SMB79032.1 transcriptional regulator, MarR family [Deinococcus hopiensis KR-140]
MTPFLTPAFLTRIRRDWEQVQPDIDPGPMLTVVLIDRLHTALGRQTERTYGAAGINAAGWDLLLTLYRSAPPQGLTPTQLSGLAAITGPSVSNRIDRLIQKGLIERQVAERDRRSVSIRLTTEGRALVERLLPEHLQRTSQIVAALDPEETRLFGQLAARLLAHLEAEERAPGDVQPAD